MKDHEGENIMDMSPAKWIWFPSERTLANTFVLFRKTFSLEQMPLSALGRITADSRYRLFINGRRIQWGPAPCDPRSLEVDPLDIKQYLTTGENVIAAEVLFYGSGDGTWAAGGPGFICSLELKFDKQEDIQIISDRSWLCLLDRAHKPGQYKRWYLRSLQEEFNALLHPHGWDKPGFKPDEKWTDAMELDGPADKPACCAIYYDYLWGSEVHDRTVFNLIERRIPLAKNMLVPVKSLSESGYVKWKTDPDDWFEFKRPDSFEIVHKDSVSGQKGQWTVSSSGEKDVCSHAIFELDEQITGWPYMEIQAPQGTIIEMIFQESHVPGNTSWLDTHYFSWSRYICKEGLNFFECFDYECLKWIQLHIRNASGPVTIKQVGVRRHLYDRPCDCDVSTSDKKIQKVFNACTNTLYNAAIETIVDGMGRERNQYSGDIGHANYAIRYGFAGNQLSKRFIQSYSEGQKQSGDFLASWPGFDRLVRMGQKEINMTGWVGIIDHSVQFVFDCWNYYFDTADKETVGKVYPKLKRFAQSLIESIGSDGLLPVEDKAGNIVWIDHFSYAQQKHKICPYNLYAAAMFTEPLAKLAEIFEGLDTAEKFRTAGRKILDSAIKNFWSKQQQLFVNNLPWSKAEGMSRYCDRSLATAVLFRQIPSDNYAPAIEKLANCKYEWFANHSPQDVPAMSVAFPPNMIWRYQALAKHGRNDVLTREFRDIWYNLNSVQLNNTCQEFWVTTPDTPDEFSHISVPPLITAYMDIAGIRALSAGFETFKITPQPADLPDLHLTCHTVKGAFIFDYELKKGKKDITIQSPEKCSGTLNTVYLDGENKLLEIKPGKNVFSFPA